MERTIEDLNKCAQEATKVYRNTEDYLEVKARDLQQWVRDLRRVADALRQDTKGDTMEKLLLGVEEIKKKLSEPKKAETKT